MADVLYLIDEEEATKRDVGMRDGEEKMDKTEDHSWYGAYT